jgi:hypothetical protein
MKNSLYGLRQSPRMLYQNLILICWDLASQGEKRIIVYLKLIGDHLIYLFLYVDDILLIGNDKEIIQDVKNQLSYKFDMNDLGVANFILRM